MTEKESLEQLFRQEIKGLWSIEMMLTEAMPAMIKNATYPALKMSLASHLAETDQHRVALELICKQLGFEHDGNENLGMKKILQEAEELIRRNTQGHAVDKVIIAAARKVEHYEIAAYQSAAHYTELLGFIPIASRLRLTLEEEQQAENKLHFLENEIIASYETKPVTSLEALKDFTSSRVSEF